MRISLVLAVLAAILLPSCNRAKVDSAQEPVPELEDAPEETVAEATAPAPSTPPAKPPAPAVNFRTPPVTTDLVEERDLLPSGANVPVKDKGDGTIIARPPVTGDSE